MNRDDMIKQLKRADMIKQLRAADSMATPQADVVKDEMPDWLSDSRAVVKNLSNNDDEALKYLQTQHPDAEFKKQGDDIIARKKGEAAFGKLDPSFSPISNPIGTIKDLWNDTKDLGYDAAQGVAEGVGTAAGAFAGLGPGSLPAAMVGGAAGSAVASTAKEALRKHYGLTDEMSGANIATDAALGGLIPGGFHVAGKGLGIAAKKVAPYLYSKATGLSVNALKDIAGGADALSDAEAGNLIKNIRGKISDGVDSAKDRFKQEYTALRGADAHVSIDPVIQRLDNAIAIAKEKRVRTGSNLLGEEERALQAMKDRIFAANDNGQIRTLSKSTSQNVGESAAPKQVQKFDQIRGSYMEDAPVASRGVQYIPEGAEIQHIKGNMGVSDAMDLNQAIKNAYIDYSDNIGGKMGTGNTVSAQEERAAHELSKILGGHIDEATGGALGATNKKYSQAIDDVDYLNRMFKTDTKTEHTLRNLRKGKNRVLKGNIDKLDDVTKKDLQDAINKLEIADYFHTPEDGNYIRSSADSLLGKTPLSKVLQAGGALGGYLTGGGYAGSAFGGLAGRKLGDLVTSPEAVRAITRFAKEKGIKTETAMKAIADNPKLMALIYGATAATNK